MKIFFVRHGQTDFNALNLVQGQEVDAPLNEVGIEQAKKARELLPEGITLILCSPLLRARQTAEILNERLAAPLAFDYRLKEMRYGSLAGKGWEEISAITGDPDAERKDSEACFDYRPYGGESAGDVMVRVTDFLTEAEPTLSKETVLVCSHGGIHDALQIIAFGKKTEELPNAAIRSLEIILPKTKFDPNKNRRP